MGWVSLGMGSSSALGVPGSVLSPQKEVATCQMNAEWEVDEHPFPPHLFPDSPPLPLLKPISHLTTACSRAFCGSPVPTAFF